MVFHCWHEAGINPMQIVPDGPTESNNPVFIFDIAPVDRYYGFASGMGASVRQSVPAMPDSVVNRTPNR